VIGGEISIGVCGLCGHDGRLGRRAHGELPDLCRRCYRPHQPKRKCGICGKVGAIRLRGRNGSPDVCGNCVPPRPPAACGRCGRVGRVICKATATSPALGVCCYRPPVDRCGDCGRQRPCVGAGGPTPRCQTCHGLRKTKPCLDCGRHLRPDRRVEGGVLCQGCALRRGSTTAPCHGCEALAPLITGHCAACRLKARVDQLRSNGDPAAVTQLDPYLRALASAPVAPSTLRWLQTPGSGVLREALTGQLEISHAAFDDRQGNASAVHEVGFLRAQLVHHGVLPERDEASAAFSRWQQRATEEITLSVDRAHVRAYAGWHVAHHLAKPRPRDTPARSKHARSRVTQAIKLTLWLHAQDLRLADLRQDLLDEWLVAGSTTSRVVRPFCEWLTRAGVSPVLHVAWNQTGPRAAPLSDEQRMAILRRLLHEPGIQPRDRLAGCLLLLYAQPLTRTVELTTESISRRDDGEVAVVLARGPVLLPEPLATIARQLREQRIAQLGGDGWLFAGRKAGHHLPGETLRARLKPYGLSSCSGRQSALLALGARLPAPILAERIGLHPARAANWVRAAGASYAEYVALRT